MGFLEQKLDCVFHCLVEFDLPFLAACFRGAIIEMSLGRDEGAAFQCPRVNQKRRTISSCPIGTPRTSIVKPIRSPNVPSICRRTDGRQNADTQTPPTAVILSSVADCGASATRLWMTQTENTW